LTVLTAPRSPPFPYTTLFRSAARSPQRAPSCSSSQRLMPSSNPSSRAPMKPPSEPPAATMRWHGTTTGIGFAPHAPPTARGDERSEEHTSELQSRGHLVCRLL